ncbi:DUF1194 domain-containing protein [Mesorhizobium sp.]|uniref:DUF1194 domain-containing protein n=1 Tax=Mesorhizobium sp. TaxID=1871066 RepID=UPI000FE5C9EA|nr:DUF1194 domain-containing protein [Mesorhizobium sp.]RWO21286.1 MAG: DUF1194 domain-containing protein [Mesorhizobium sp.]
MSHATLRSLRSLVSGVCLLAATVPFPGARAWANDVDAAIVFAVDKSASINIERATLQRQGHVGALRSKEVAYAIAGGLVGCIAITYIQWSSVGRLQTVLPWTTICDSGQAAAAASTIDRAGDTGQGRSSRGRTSLSFAIDVSGQLLDRFPGTARKNIIDVSSNGTNNDGLPVTESRRRAVAKGYIINAIAVERTEPGITTDLPGYFRENVIGGAADYSVAIRRKLVLEISSATPSNDRTTR